MTPSRALAIRAAHRAATLYTAAWVAFVVAWVATPMIVIVAAPAAIGDDAFGALAALALLTLPLIVIADSVQCYALGRFGRAVHHPDASPVFYAVLALLLPFGATTASVSCAQEGAARSIERAPAFPSSRLTWLWPVAVVFVPPPVVALVVAILSAVGAAPAGASDDMVAVIVGGTLLLQVAAFGCLRIVLGRRLRSAFSELRSRPAVDAMRTAGVEPVAGN